MKAKLSTLLMIMVLISMVFVSAASGNTSYLEENTTINESKSKESITPYATINAYGNNEVNVGEEIDIYVSGEIGNILNGYYEKFYVKNLDTGEALDRSEYTTVADGENWVFIDEWSEINNVIAHETFSQHWGVTINEPGTYEVVASVVGIGTIPKDQDRFIITVSE